jgi:hypothetical protein
VIKVASATHGIVDGDEAHRVIATFFSSPTDTEWRDAKVQVRSVWLGLETGESEPEALH